MRSLVWLRTNNQPPLGAERGGFDDRHAAIATAGAPRLERRRGEESCLPPDRTLLPGVNRQVFRTSTLSKADPKDNQPPYEDEIRNSGLCDRPRIRSNYGTSTENSEKATARSDRLEPLQEAVILKLFPLPAATRTPPVTSLLPIAA